MGYERIDHDIAHQPDFVLGNSFPAKILIGILGWSQEQISQRIGHDSVDLLRHGPIEAAQARFHMGCSHAHLCRHQCAGHGGVDIANYDDPIGWRTTDH